MILLKIIPSLPIWSNQIDPSATPNILLDDERIHICPLTTEQTTISTHFLRLLKQKISQISHYIVSPKSQSEKKR